MNTYKPTYKDRCEDEDCEAYGKPLVDRGYGMPVCPTTKWRSAYYPGSSNIPMNARYLDAPDLTDTQYYCEKCDFVFGYSYVGQHTCECCGGQILDNNICEVKTGGKQ